MVMSATGSGSCSAGSTLIELLVGLVIVTVMLGAAAMAFPDADGRRAERAVARAHALIELACERAELTGQDIGIGIEGRELVFGSYRSGEWQALADSPQEALRRRRLGAAVMLELRVDGPMRLRSSGATVGEQAVCMASGELTPFVLDLRGPAGQHWSLRGDQAGNLQRVNGNAR